MFDITRPMEIKEVIETFVIPNLKGTPCIIVENKVDLLLEYPQMENIWNISGINIP